MAVELFDPFRKYTAPSNAKLVYNGGPLMDDAKVVGVFFDELSGDTYALQAQMDGFLKWVGGSDVFTEEGEYNTNGFVLAPGSYLGSYKESLTGSTPPPPPPPPPAQDCGTCLNDCLNGPCQNAVRTHLDKAMNKHRANSSSSGHVLTDADVQKLLSDALAAGRLPKADANTLYILFFPTGVTIQMDAQDASCQTFCGYHSNFDIGGVDVKYAVLPFPDCQGCTAGRTPFDALTATTTHEIAEAITDPDPGSGWYDQANGEVGDICAWQFRQDGPYNVQLLWSNHRKACI